MNENQNRRPSSLTELQGNQRGHEAERRVGVPEGFCRLSATDIASSHLREKS